MFEAKTAKEIVAKYPEVFTSKNQATNIKQVSRWIKAIAETFPNDTLKIGTGNRIKYSPFCVQKIDEIATCYHEGKTIGDWKSTYILIEEKLNKLDEVPLVPTEVVDERKESSSDLAPINYQKLESLGIVPVQSFALATYNSDEIQAQNIQSAQNLITNFNTAKEVGKASMHNFTKAVGAELTQAGMMGLAESLAPLMQMIGGIQQAQKNQVKGE